MGLLENLSPILTTDVDDYCRRALPYKICFIRTNSRLVISSEWSLQQVNQEVSRTGHLGYGHALSFTRIPDAGQRQETASFGSEFVRCLAGTDADLQCSLPRGTDHSCRAQLSYSCPELRVRPAFRSWLNSLHRAEAKSEQVWALRHAKQSSTTRRIQNNFALIVSRKAEERFSSRMFCFVFWK